MSINCEHFIYTAGNTGLKKGYQIVSKSDSVDESILNDLINYLYPIGVNTSIFNKSKSLIIINKSVVYSIIKNIGYGNDGRSGTLYNHTFLMHVDEFKKLNNDSRIFDDYFIDSKKSHKNLKSLNIKPKNIKIDFKYLNNLNKNFLGYAISSLLKKHKVAIYNNFNENLIQNILSVLPLDLRLTGFSSYVIQPHKQPKYKIMQIAQSHNIKLNKNCIILDESSIKSINFQKDSITSQLINAINDKNKKKIEIIHNKFTNSKKSNKKIIDGESEKIIQNGNSSLLSEVMKNFYLNNNFNAYSITNIVNFIIKFRKIIDPLLITYEDKHKKNELISLISIIKIFSDYLSHIKKYKIDDVNNILSKKIHDEININNLILKRHELILKIIKNNEKIKLDYSAKLTNIISESSNKNGDYQFKTINDFDHNE